MAHTSSQSVRDAAKAKKRANLIRTQTFVLPFRGGSTEVRELYKLRDQCHAWIGAYEALLEDIKIRLDEIRGVHTNFEQTRLLFEDLFVRH